MAFPPAKSVALLSSVAVVLATAVPAADDNADAGQRAATVENLVDNGGFEIVDETTGLPDGWRLWRPVGDGEVHVISGDVAEGTRAVEFTNDSDDDRITVGRPSRPIPNPDRPHVVVVSYAERAVDVARGYAGVRIQFRDADGNQTAPHLYPGGARGTTDGWRRVEATGFAPAGTTHVLVEPFLDSTRGRYAVDDVRVTVVETDPGPIDAKEFFGIWDDETARWVLPSRIDYTSRPDLAPVEQAVRAGDYEAAKEHLLAYYRGRPAKVTPGAGSTGTVAPGLIELALDHIWTLGSGEVYHSTLAVTGQEQTVRTDVTTVVQEAVAAGEVGFMLMARNKEPSTAVFHSKESAEGKPTLGLTLADGSATSLTATQDTYIKGGPDAETVFGAAPVLEVRDEGDGPFSDETRKAYVRFDLTGIEEPPTSATLELTGRNATTDTEKQIMLFHSKESFDEATRTWAGTVQNTFSWQQDPGGFDWKGPAGSDPEYSYQLPRFNFAKPTADEYARTGDETLAGGLVELMTDFIHDADSYGTQYGAGSFPRSLDSAIRATAWVNAYEALRVSPSLDAQSNYEILSTLHKTAQYMATATNPTPNWMQTQKAALVHLAVYFPEFAKGAEWRDDGQTFLTNQLDEVLYPDGGYAEASDSYAFGVVRGFLGIARFLQANGYEFEGAASLGRLAWFLADQLYPNGFGPNYGDSNYVDQRPTIRDVAELLDDDELRYIGTSGAAGAEPDHTSALYPDTRVAVLRGGWHPDDAYLRINADRGAHSHPDELAIAAYAHGRPLLVNTGAFTYSDDPRSRWLRFETEANNTVEIDNTRQTSTAEGGITSWAHNPGFDFTEAYTDGTPGVRHTRSVLYVRPDLWIVSDLLSPSDDDVHRYEQNWHLLPEADIRLDPTTKQTSSNFSTGADISIVPADPERVEAAIRDGHYSPAFYTVTEAKFATYTKRVSGPTSFDTVLVPRPDGVERTTQVRRIPVVDAAPTRASALDIRMEGDAPLLATSYLSHEEPQTRSVGDLRLRAKAAFVARTPGASTETWLVHDATLLERVGRPLVTSPTPVPDLTVRLDQRRRVVELSGSGLVATADPATAIGIAARWATKVTLNGEPVPFTVSGGLLYAAGVQ